MRTKATKYALQERARQQMPVPPPPTTEEIERNRREFLDKIGRNPTTYPSEPHPGAKAFADAVTQECREIAEMLIEKNRAYGNSVLEPIRCFARASTVEQIKVRIDDKLSRLMRGQEAGEDTIKDLIGYLIILRIAEV